MTAARHHAAVFFCALKRGREEEERTAQRFAARLGGQYARLDGQPARLGGQYARLDDQAAPGCQVNGHHRQRDTGNALQMLLPFHHREHPHGEDDRDAICQ